MKDHSSLANQRLNDCLNRKALAMVEQPPDFAQFFAGMSKIEFNGVPLWNPTHSRVLRGPAEGPFQHSSSAVSSSLYVNSTPKKSSQLLNIHFRWTARKQNRFMWMDLYSHSAVSSPTVSRVVKLKSHFRLEWPAQNACSAFLQFIVNTPHVINSVPNYRRSGCNGIIFFGIYIEWNHHCEWNWTQFSNHFMAKIQPVIFRTGLRRQTVTAFGIDFFPLARKGYERQ